MFPNSIFSAATIGVHKVQAKSTQFWNMSFGLIFLIVMQNFAAIRSVILEKITFEVAIFGNYLDILELKLSLSL